MRSFSDSLSGLSPTLSQPQKTQQRTRLGYNGLTRPIPTELADLPNLETLPLGKLPDGVHTGGRGERGHQRPLGPKPALLPPAPEGLAETSTKTSIKVSWSAVPNTTKYRVEHPSSQCHQAAWHRRYWDHLAPVVDQNAFARLPYCPPARHGYQLFRQQALAEGIAQSGKYELVVSAVAVDEHRLPRSLGTGEGGERWALTPKTTEPTPLSTIPRNPHGG